MASYHMCCKVISRGQGRSATAAAAYRAAERIFDRRTGIEHDYSRKQGVVRDEVLLPRDAPEPYRDRSELWNAVEESERRSNSQLAREFELALPRELCRDEQFDLARGWAERKLVSRGMCADVCMHDRGDGNPHAHIMATTREVGPEGFTVKNRDWNDKALLVDLRKSWEREQNRALERSYERDRTPEVERSYVDCRSYAARGIDREPTMHEGPAVRAMESRERERCAAEGREYEPVTDRARENELIMERNALVERPSGII
ncbi:MAG: MobQ family relaxase [Senegalimassilia anaerobia]|uniref:MobQ family relaxase n=1 Tax=Senegalimassilia anaerobia TaxID=1473216 RepID=UPI002E7891E3|nr:MobQ family relaxase [Senegalimassilia anaerobia]MEE0304326.1 MobQ family relaxase [Senegalimassilia anaerobia]